MAAISSRAKFARKLTVIPNVIHTTDTLDADAQGQVLKNCQAWQAQKGLSKPDAIRKYVTKAEQLVAAYSK